MDKQSVDRRLTAILSADVVGYTRLMASDEVGTIRALNWCREQIRREVARNRGRVVDSHGDNVLTEFPSATDAVRCAAETQTALAARNGELPAERRMPFRIGVHLGEVMVEGERIYGDGVNVAARLEAEAEPGGVCLSAKVVEEVRGKIDLSFAYVEGEGLMMGIKDLAVSSGSACTSASLEPSYVLRALGVGEDLAHTSLRIGLGRYTTTEEVDYAVEKIAGEVERLRDMSPLWDMAQEGIDIASIDWAEH